MFRKLSLAVTTATVAALLAMSPGVAGAQTAGAQQNQPPPMQRHMDGSNTMTGTAGQGSTMNCQHMRTTMQEMRAKREQMQATLDELAAKVKATHGAEQQAAMAELLTTMVDQRHIMNDMMSKMQSTSTSGMTRTTQADATGTQVNAGDMSGGSMMHGSMMNGSKNDVGHGRTGS
jgi:hypothetical protein